MDSFITVPLSYLMQYPDVVAHLQRAPLSRVVQQNADIPKRQFHLALQLQPQ
jgi:hypothetical protein